MRIICAIACAVWIAGCATIVKGTSQSVAVDTPGAPGALCELSSPEIGTQTVKTPGTIVLEKSQHNIEVKCRKACFQDGIGIIPSNTESMAVGNILAGGVIGLGVDAASGAMNKYADRTTIVMIPVRDCRV